MLGVESAHTGCQKLVSGRGRSGVPLVGAEQSLPLTCMSGRWPQVPCLSVAASTILSAGTPHLPPAGALWPQEASTIIAQGHLLLSDPSVPGKAPVPGRAMCPRVHRWGPCAIQPGGQEKRLLPEELSATATRQVEMARGSLGAGTGSLLGPVVRGEKEPRFLWSQNQGGCDSCCATCGVFRVPRAGGPRCQLFCLFSPQPSGVCAQAWEDCVRVCRCEPALCVHMCKRVGAVMLHPSLTVTWRRHSHRLLPPHPTAARSL